MPNTYPAAPVTNELKLYASAVEYPCIHLDETLIINPADRESYVDIGEGTEPILARVWMAKTQWDAMPSGVKAGTTPVGIIMIGAANEYPADPSAANVTSRTLTFTEKFYIISSVIARQALDLPVYEVRLATEQYYWKWKTIKRTYNLLSADKTKFVAGAVSSSSANTYQTIVTDIKNDLGIVAALTLSPSPTAQPFNVVIDRQPGGRALSRLLRPLAMQVVADPYTSTSVLTYTVVQLDYSVASDKTEMDRLSKWVGVEGANSAFTDPAPNPGPASVDILFPIYPVPDSASVTSSTYERYTVVNATNPGTGVSGTKDILYVGDHFDVTGKTYAETLANIATERGAAYFKRLKIASHVYVFAGGYKILPGQQIRRVRITMDGPAVGALASGWFTTVWLHGQYDVVREDAEAHFAKTKAPHFPEHGMPYHAQVFPRDDGTIDVGGQESCLSSPVDDLTGGVGAPTASTWDYTTGHAVMEEVLTDVQYVTSPSPAFKATKRTRVTNSCGALIALSAETEYTITDLEDCPPSGLSMSEFLAL